MDTTTLLAQAGESGMTAQGVLTLLFVVFGFIVYKTPKGVWTFIGKKMGLKKRVNKWKEENRGEEKKEKKGPNLQSDLPPDVVKYAVSTEREEEPEPSLLLDKLDKFDAEQEKMFSSDEPPTEIEAPPFEDYRMPEGTASDDPMVFLNPVSWAQICRKRKLGGLQFLGRNDTPFGIDVSVKFGGALSFAYVQANIDQLRTGLNLPHDWRIQLKRGHSSAYGTVRIITHDPLKSGLAWQPSPNTVRLADPLLISRTAYGEDVHVSVKRRLGIFGTSGSGKSCTQRLVAAHVIQAIDADLEIWDLKFGVESQHFEEKAHRVTTVQEAVERTRWLMEVEYPRRAEIMKGRRASSWEEAQDNRALVVMIDEGDEITKGFTKPQMDKLGSCIKMGRALGVYFVWATQYPKAESLPSDIRGQFDCRICLLLMNAEESRIVYKEAVDEGWAPHLLIGPGWMFIKDTEHRTPEESKALWLPKESIPAIPMSGALETRSIERSNGLLSDSSVAEDICRVLSDPDAPLAMGVSELSRRTGRTKSGIHGALTRMVEAGQVCKTDEDKPLYFLPPAGTG